MTIQPSHRYQPPSDVAKFIGRQSPEGFWGHSHLAHALCASWSSLHNHLAQSELIQGNFSTNWHLKAQLLSFCLAELRICRSLWGMQDNREKHSGNSQHENYPGKVLGGLKTICCMTPLIHLQCRGQNLYCLSGAAVPGHLAAAPAQQRQVEEEEVKVRHFLHHGQPCAWSGRGSRGSRRRSSPWGCV